jgi:hypothetical protein
MKRILPVALALLVGCDSGTTTTRPGVGIGGVEAGPPLTAVEAHGHGTLAGRVTFDGTPPVMKDIDVGNNPHKEYCCKPGLKDETWVVDPATKGVANVVVWLQPPQGEFFPPQPDDRRTWPQVVTVDQPYCAFEPRVSVLFPMRYDATANRLVPTGQEFRVLNSASIIHSLQIKGNDKINPAQKTALPAKPANGKPNEYTASSLKPDRGPLELRCDLHPWMKGYAWAFDHPYAAVTKPDGSFTIRDVPAGVDLELKAWHEAGTVSGVGPVRLEDGKTLTRNLTVK